MKTSLSEKVIQRLKNCKKYQSKKLDLSGCDLTFIPKEINEFSWLTELDLSRNQIAKIENLDKFPKLSKLTLHSNQITRLENLDKLYNLTELDLSRNRITRVEKLSKLPKLTNLDLHSNQISKLEKLDKFLNLTELDLFSNRIKNLKSLLPLLSYNQLNIVFKKNKRETKKGEINIENCPITSPPLEITQQGNQAIFDWFEANKKKLNEIKIILIGEPKAGKTSLLKRLKDNDFDEQEVQTDGINIERIEFGKNKNFSTYTSLKELTGHFWDFGGQEIMNATHQFFLTKRSIYVIVLDARKDTDVSAQVRKWAEKIRTIGGKSPIIVVGNKSDINTGFGFENEYDLQQEFPQIKYFIKVSSKTKEHIELLKEKLEEIIPKAELFNTEIDERWISIKEELQKDTQENNFLNESKFLEICQTNQLNNKREQKNAISFLNDLGLVLHFETVNPEYFVLDPYWITYGVYQIITSTYAGKQKGEIAIDKLDYIINEEEAKEKVYQPKNYRKISYSYNERRFLVDILNQFKLCYYLPNQSHFIIPDLLDTIEPTAQTIPIRESEDNIKFVYEYEYLPKSVMPYIMVETHKIISAKWRTGCILENIDCEGLISAYQNRLSIIVTGTHKKKREFMSIIRYTIDTINSASNYKPTMLIPLKQDFGFADYEELLEREKDGERYLIRYKPRKEKFEISKLLEGISLQSEMTLLQERVDIVLSKVKVVDAKMDRMDSKLDTVILLSNLNADNHKYIESIFDRGKLIEAALFRSVQEERNFYKQANQYFEQLATKEKEELKGWQNGDDKQKLKAVLNLGILKYERELEIKDFKVPRTWEELKAVFLL